MHHGVHIQTVGPNQLAAAVVLLGWWGDGDGWSGDLLQVYAWDHSYAVTLVFVFLVNVKMKMCRLPGLKLSICNTNHIVSVIMFVYICKWEY